MKVFDEIFSAQIVLAKHFFAPIHYLLNFRNALLPLPSTCAIDLDLVEILILLLPFTILVRIGGKVLVEVMVGVKPSIVAAWPTCPCPIKRFHIIKLQGVFCLFSLLLVSRLSAGIACEAGKTCDSLFTIAERDEAIGIKPRSNEKLFYFDI